MNKYNGNYWFYLPDTIEIEAENEAKAIAKVEQMVESPELASDLNKMPLSGSGVAVS